MISRDDLKVLCRRQVTVAAQKLPLHKTGLIVFMAVLLILIVVFPAMVTHSKQKPMNPISEHRDIDHELQENLEQLRQLKNLHHIKLHPAAQRALHGVEPASVNPLVSLREHAPTSMYLSNDVALNPSEKTNFSSSLYIDHSVYANFANQRVDAQRISAIKIPHPDFTIVQGEMIHAILETAINSDLPGMIRATVSEPVYSYLGDHRLIPKGARLIGQYSSQTQDGIDRVMILWQRLILPEGVSIQLESGAADELGQSGSMPSSVNRHFWKRFGEASLLSLIGATTATVGVNDQSGDNALQRYRSGVSQSFRESAHGSFSARSDIKPSLHVRQGSEINVFVAKDLDFYGQLK